MDMTNLSTFRPYLVRNLNFIFMCNSIEDTDKEVYKIKASIRVSLYLGTCSVILLERLAKFPRRVVHLCYLR